MKMLKGVFGLIDGKMKKEDGEVCYLQVGNVGDQMINGGRGEDLRKEEEEEDGRKRRDGAVKTH